ncbi:MAG TPA: hypothetical protein PKH39_19900, partial [Woeseiaceae bacterium]|nr:hypothetical protein [Woeseiaceae bacterium]
PKTTYETALQYKAHAMEQAEAYSTTFRSPLYATNSPQFIAEVGNIFQKEGWENIRFLLVPARRF